MEVPLRKIEIQTETACHDLFSLLLVCMAITRYKLHFERVLRIFWGIIPALVIVLLQVSGIYLRNMDKKEAKVQVVSHSDFS